MTNRSAELAKIHIAKKDLALDDELYRQILWTVARVRSAKDLDAHGRGAVLDHFKSRGWKPKAAKRAGRVPHTLNRKAELTKIEAQLADMGLSWAYADTIAKHISGIDRVAWLKKSHHFAGVIAALEVEQKKRGRLVDIEQMIVALGRESDAVRIMMNAQRTGWRRNLAQLGQIRDYLIRACDAAGIDPLTTPLEE